MSQKSAHPLNNFLRIKRKEKEHICKYWEKIREEFKDLPTRSSFFSFMFIQVNRSELGLFYEIVLVCLGLALVSTKDQLQLLLC